MSGAWVIRTDRKTELLEFFFLSIRKPCASVSGGFLRASSDVLIIAIILPRRVAKRQTPLLFQMHCDGDIWAGDQTADE